jgi:hypothetical protein
MQSSFSAQATFSTFAKFVNRGFSRREDSYFTVIAKFSMRSIPLA